MDQLTAAAAAGSDFGLVKPVEPSHHSVTTSSVEWATAASNEFAILRGKLASVIGHYDENEDAGTTTARRMHTGSGDEPV